MQFTGSHYQGLTTSDGKRFDDLGRYTFANGDMYVGGMLDGVFHGHGILFFRKRHGSDAADEGMGTPAAAERECAAADGEDGKASLMAFLDGSSRKDRDAPLSVAAPPAANSLGDAATRASEWSGQFRGVWEHGRSVAGSYLFFDGLVYSSETHPGGAAERERERRRQHEAPLTGSGGADSKGMVWPYCECNDRRVWVEHLRNITPVLPCETPLGGLALQAALAAPPRQEGSPRRWTDVPVVVPNSPETDLTPSVLADGQPQSGADVVAWDEVFQAAAAGTAGAYEALQSTARVLSRPTQPLVEEQDPDVEIGADGTVQRRRRRVTNPNYQPRYLLLARASGEGRTASGVGERTLASHKPKPTSSTQAVPSPETVHPTNSADSTAKHEETPPTEAVDSDDAEGSQHGVREESDEKHHVEEGLEDAEQAAATPQPPTVKIAEDSADGEMARSRKPSRLTLPEVELANVDGSPVAPAVSAERHEMESAVACDAAVAGAEAEATPEDLEEEQAVDDGGPADDAEVDE